MSPAGVTGLVAGWLAQVPPPGAPPGSERGEEFGKTSPIALVVIILLGLATALLIRSMNSRLRNIPESFDDPEPDPDRNPAGSEGEETAREHAFSDGDDAPDADPPPHSGGGTEAGRTEGGPRTGSP